MKDYVEMASEAIEQIETGSTAPEPEIIMQYAIVKALADIATQIEILRRTIETFQIY